MAEFIAVVGIAASFLQVADLLGKITKNLASLPSSAETQTDIRLIEYLVDQLSTDNWNCQSEPSSKTAKLLESCITELKELNLAVEMTCQRDSPLRHRVINSIRKANKGNLISTSTRLNRLVAIIQLLKQDQLLSKSSSTTAEDESNLLGLEQEKSMVPQQSLNWAIQQYRSKNKSNCRRGTCKCLCHQGFAKDVKTKPARVLGMGISKCECTFKRHYWTVLFQRTIIALEVVVQYEQGFSISISPSFRVTVPRTSPGFSILFQLERGLLDLSSAVVQLRDLRQSGQISFSDIDPDGNGYLEKLLKYPWKGDYYNQFGLMEFLFKQGATVNSDILLTKVLKWVGNGPHLDLLTDIIPYTDPGDCGAQLFQSWPKPLNVDFDVPNSYPDPMYIRLLSSLVKEDPDFGNTGRLQYWIFSGNLDAVRECAHTASRRPVVEKNFLGQTVLHLAVIWPRILEFILQNGYSALIDEPDQYGKTPLIYAAIYGEVESAMLLLRWSATPTHHDDSFGWTFLHFAMFRGHFTFIDKMVTFYQSLDHSIAQAILDVCIRDYFATRPFDFDLKLLNGLISRGGRLSLVNQNGDTVLHRCHKPEVVFLLNQKDIPINQANKFGITPLMKFCEYKDAEILRIALQHGAAIDSRDKADLTTFHHLLALSPELYFNSRGFSSWTRVMSAAVVILQANADISNTDRCCCPCSENGCTPWHMMFFALSDTMSQQLQLLAIPWFLELYCLITSFYSDSYWKFYLSSLFRRQRFDELGMTHTCAMAPHGWLSCNRHTTDQVSAVDEEDLAYIKDEQSMLIDELQEDCQTFSFSLESGSLDAKLLQILARRAIFINRGIIAHCQKISKRKLVLSRDVPPRVKKYEDIRIFQESPLLIYADHRRDQFGISSTSPDYTTEWKTDIRGHIQKFLDYAEKEPLYDGSTFPNDLDRSLFQSRRRTLSDQLIQEIGKIEGLSDEVLDWDLDILTGGPY